MADRVLPGPMLLALSDRGSKSPTPGSWPGRAPPAGSRLGAWASAEIDVMQSSAKVARLRQRMWMTSVEVDGTRAAWQ